MYPSIVQTIRKGGVGVMPTDTIYGIVGSALNNNTVRRIYSLRKRNPKKPMIILIGDVRDLKLFGVRPDAKTRAFLKKLWPGKVSVILPVKKFAYLHRGTRSLAFRLPKLAWLRTFLSKTGPLVAPSANFEGEKPAQTVREAKKYFSDKVDFYINAGRLVSKPSTLVEIRSGKIKVIRRGAVLVGSK